MFLANVSVQKCSLMLLFCLSGCAKIEINKIDNVFIEKQITFMDNIIRMHDKVNGIHLSLEKLYPIAVVNDGYFFIFDINELGTKYEFKHKAKTDFSDSVDWLATLYLESYNWKPAAVIGKNILANSENYVFVFHEFVHCYQGETVENDIKSNLTISKEEMEKQNYSWEINYPFPYNDDYFINKTEELSDYLTNGSYENVVNYHNDMRTYLKETEFEYMIWQEWKEGFARYVENLIRKELGSPLNTTISRQPFDRVHFYDIGSKYIEKLIEKDRRLNNDIENLFQKMYNSE